VVFFVQPIPREERGHVFAHNFFRAIAEEPLGARIPRLNHTLEILGKDGVARMVHHRGETRGCLLRFALLGHIAKNQHDAEQGAVCVANRGSTVANRSLHAVLGNQQGVIREPRNLAGAKNLFDGILHCLPGLFVDDIKHLRQALALPFEMFPTREALCFGIQESDVAIRICDDDRVANAGDGRAEKVARFDHLPLNTLALRNFILEAPPRQVHCLDCADDHQ
jgi:hypothetical protein